MSGHIKKILPPDTLDLVILDSGAPKRAVVFARSGPNVAVARLSYKKEIRDLQKVRQWIEDSMFGRVLQKPRACELADFGNCLFRLIIRDKVKTLYDQLPPSHVRILILSDSPDLQSLPWEFIQEPGKASGPRRNRSVVRVVSTIGIPEPEPFTFDKKIRVLFAYANPQDQQESVDWDDVLQSIEDSFAGWVDPSRFEIVPVREVTNVGLLQRLQQSHYDVFHFSGHGMVYQGTGRLILNDGRDQSAYITAERLAGILRDRQIKLVVLSACQTASGDFSSEFSVIAQTLVAEGIPAVVANQMPVYNQTVAPFVGTMYDQLLRHGDIDQAVSEGRMALATVLNATDLAPADEAKPDWGFPTLYRHIAGAKMVES
jgi:hypothetical protein